jgi:hypothetical protein
MNFLFHHLIHDVSPKILNFSENSKCLTTFIAELLCGIVWSKVVPYGDRAAAYIVGAASIQASAGDRSEKQKPSGRRK